MPRRWVFNALLRLTRNHPPPQSSSTERTPSSLARTITIAVQVFATKTTAEVFRAFVVMRMCQIPALVTNGDKLLSLGEKVLGQAIINSILRATFFGHFCAGEDQETIRPTVDSLKKAKVLSILDYAAEADESAKPMDAPTVKSEEWASDAPAASGSQGTVMHEVFPAPQAVARTYHYAGEESCDKHVEVFEKCIEAVHNVTPAGFAAIKLTALGPPALLKRLSSAIVELKALFDKFDVNGGARGGRVGRGRARLRESARPAAAGTDERGRRLHAQPLLFLTRYISRPFWATARHVPPCTEPTPNPKPQPPHTPGQTARSRKKSLPAATTGSSRSTPPRPRRPARPT